LLPLAALAFRRGWLLVLLLVLAPLLPLPAHATDPAHAASTASLGERWARLWHTPDQRAAQALAEHRPRQAQRLASDPAWRGAAAYRAGDYAAAAKAFAGAGPDASYNLGNALARQGRYRQALAAYARALQRDPHDADAAANRKAVEDWLRRHPPPQSPSPGMQGSGRGDGTGTSAQSQDPSQQKSSAPASQGRPAHAGSTATPHADGTPDAATAARQQAQAEQARKALQKQMDRALAGDRHGQGAYALGLAPAPATSSGAGLPPAMQQALQRVPDDPGGLLRRKFQLEHERRQGDGGSP
jgi:Ca-activated chloride channel family protein